MKKLEIIAIGEDTPNYEGYSEIVRVGKLYFRTRDGEGYHSWLEKISEKEFNRLKKYKNDAMK